MMMAIFLTATVTSGTVSPVSDEKLCDALRQNITTQASALPPFKQAYRSGTLSKLQKDEFETAAEWSARFQEAVKPLVGAGTLGHRDLVFFSIPVSRTDLEYDADREFMMLRHRISTFGDSKARIYQEKNYKLESSERVVGGYRASNAFGVSKYIEKVEQIEYSLRFSAFHFKDAPKEFYVPRNFASSFKQSMKIGVLGGFARSGIKVEKAWFEPSLEVPKDRSVTTVSFYVQPICIYLYGDDYVVTDWYLDLPNIKGIVKPEKRRFSDMFRDGQR